MSTQTDKTARIITSSILTIENDYANGLIDIDTFAYSYVAIMDMAYIVLFDSVTPNDSNVRSYEKFANNMTFKRIDKLLNRN
ncbi:hypothetical protein [Methylomonas sp. AM2-LC]|uniref:hypothetical protein n=1 Tax=Methylomonas sp. AM2-LC TaxID=3153301 RepID=UPI003265F273